MTKTIHHSSLSLLLLFAGLLGASCSGVRTGQMRGTELGTDANGNTRLTTYVSPEEYERMTEAERERLNASVGASFSKSFGSSSESSRPLTSEELDKSLKKDR